MSVFHFLRIFHVHLFFYKNCVLFKQFVVNFYVDHKMTRQDQLQKLLLYSKKKIFYFIMLKALFHELEPEFLSVRDGLTDLRTQ